MLFQWWPSRRGQGQLQETCWGGRRGGEPVQDRSARKKEIPAKISTSTTSKCDSIAHSCSHSGNWVFKEHVEEFTIWHFFRCYGSCYFVSLISSKIKRLTSCTFAPCRCRVSLTMNTPQSQWTCYVSLLYEPIGTAYNMHPKATVALHHVSYGNSLMCSLFSIFFFTFPNTAWITNNKNRKLISICWGFFYWTNKGLIFIGWKCHITTTCWCLIPLFVLQTLHNEVLPLALLWRLSWGTLSTQPGAMRSRPTTLLQLPARAVILIHTQGVLSVFSTCASPTLLHEPFYCCES